jgi:hypothetical protein
MGGIDLSILPTYPALTAGCAAKADQVKGRRKAAFSVLRDRFEQPS